MKCVNTYKGAIFFVVIPCSVFMPSMHCDSTIHVLVIPAHTP
jgi:hypothetical protein